MDQLKYHHCAFHWHGSGWMFQRSLVTCQEGYCVSRSSSWHEALGHPEKGNKEEEGHGFPAVTSPPGWTPCPVNHNYINNMWQLWT